MATKTWKIGEYAKGGIITVETTKNVVVISCKDWDTKKVISSYGYTLDQPTSRYSIENHLNDLTSSYYAGKILEWIESKVDLAPQEFFGSFHNYSGRQGTKKPYGQNRANATLIR